MIRTEPSGAGRLESALRAAGAGRLAVMPYVTAGHPAMKGFPGLLGRISRFSDAIEVGIPFSAPIADGVTIQRSSRMALHSGVTLGWTLDAVREAGREADTPTVLMSYLNPLLAFGLERFAEAAVSAGVSGLVVPDLPLEESGPLAAILAAAGIALVQLVTPLTPDDRLRRLCHASRGFVYAVTLTGTTGGTVEPSRDLSRYLDRVRAASTLPVMAGFGLRFPAQVGSLRGHADGFIVGSALVECLERGEDPVPFMRAFRDAGVRSGRCS